MKIAVLGSGGWGTALAMLLEENGHQVTLWSYLEQESKQLQVTGENPLLPGVQLPAGLSYTWDLDCVVGSDVVVMATPSFGVRSTAEQIAGRLSPGTVLVSVSKGIEKGTFLRMSQIIREATGDRFPVVTLSGPSHAEEVARKVPTAVVSASPDRAAAEQVQDLFLNDHFRVYSSSDVVGVELGAALKNVMALCTGCCTGMGYGDNTKAMLMTRGLTEIARLGVGAQVRLLGRIEHQFLPPYYHACDLFTTASLSEMNSISMLEAMASGLYVIQRLDIYNKNQITPGENGNVFNTSEEMAALLREEAALTPEQRALRRQKVTAFTQRYGEKEFIRAVLNVYERAMAEYKAKMKIKAKAKSKGVR